MANAGAPAQVAKATELLAGTRRALYRLLAEDADVAGRPGEPTPTGDAPAPAGNAGDPGR